MKSEYETIIQTLESRLKNAMLESNTDELNELLADDLIFTNHFGHLVTKQDDLEAHQSGMLKIEDIEITEQIFKLIEGGVIVSALTRIVGSYNGESAENKFRFSRVWNQNQAGEWRVIMAHSTLVA